MRKLRYTFVVGMSAAMLAVQASQGQSLRGAARAESIKAPRTDTARIAGWRSDVDSLVALVRGIHWRFRDAPLPAEFTQRARRLRADVPSLEDDRIVVELQAVLATLHDGHSLLYPFGMRRGGLSRLPIALYAFDDGLAVIAADSAHAALIGRRVYRIEGVPVTELVVRLTPLLSLENAAQLRWAFPTYLTFPAFLRAAGVATATSEVRIAVDSGTATREVRLRAITPPMLEASLLSRWSPPWPRHRNWKANSGRPWQTTAR